MGLPLSRLLLLLQGGLTLSFGFFVTFIFAVLLFNYCCVFYIYCLIPILGNYCLIFSFDIYYLVFLATIVLFSFSLITCLFLLAF